MSPLFDTTPSQLLSVSPLLHSIKSQSHLITPCFSFNRTKTDVFLPFGFSRRFVGLSGDFFPVSFNGYDSWTRRFAAALCYLASFRNELSSPVIVAQILRALPGFRGSKGRLHLKRLLSNGATAVCCRVIPRASHFPDISITKPHADIDLYYTAHSRPYYVLFCNFASVDPPCASQIVCDSCGNNFKKRVFISQSERLVLSGSFLLLPQPQLPSAAWLCLMNYCVLIVQVGPFQMQLAFRVFWKHLPAI